MNRRRFFNLSLAAVGAALFTPWEAVKAWAKSVPQVYQSKRAIRGIAYYIDWSKPDCMGMFADPDLEHLIEREAWVGGGVEPEWRSGRGTDD